MASRTVDKEEKEEKKSSYQKRWGRGTGTNVRVASQNLWAVPGNKYFMKERPLIKANIALLLLNKS